MTFDYELYDRQIRTFGLNATLKINASSVAVIGLEQGLATEILKNLALCGILNLYLVKDGIIKYNDLLNGYYYNLEDVGKLRNLVLKNKIEELNPYVKVSCIDSIDEITANIIICINNNNNEIKNLNNYCRINNKKFISVQSSNNKGIIFVDAGTEHLVTNISGENYEPIQIISLDETGKITTNGHDFQSGDTILLTNLQGDNIKQFNKEYVIENINNLCFKLNNFEFNKFNFVNGTAVYIDKPIYINHNNYETEIINPTMNFLSDESIIKNYIKSNIEIVSVNSIMGSLVASEAIKLVSNKYLPINQWFTWHDPDLDIHLAHEKLLNSEFFIVGSGAIGCELLKNLAFLNVKKILITDPDTIEKSNLSRQFLFRNDDIGKLKSQVASKAIKLMKPTLTIEYFSEKVGDDTVNFTNRILQDKNLTSVFNALDNINARRFMDTQCFNNNKSLFESGTMGVKGNTQPVIPFITETYSNSNDPNNEKSFAVCTIKNFPNEIQHTIHWAMDQFEFFNRSPNNINKWLLNKNMIFNNDVEGLQMNKDVWEYTTKYNITDCISCVYWAIDMFNEYYYNQIIQLLINFPIDTLTKEGTLFWSSGKRCPVPIKINSSNNNHLNFIETTTILLCNCVNIEYNIDNNKLIEIINAYPIKDYIPSDKTNITSKILEINKNSNIKIGIPQIFDKDNDNNYHIKWITAVSNLRAENYSIEPSDFYTTKGIAGKIIPAVATTTSIVAGLITIEMIKYLCYNNIDKFKSTFINLALNTFVSAEPIEQKSLKIAGQLFNSWHKFIEYNNLTINNFLIKYNLMFKTTITMLCIGNVLIYADFLGDENNNKTLNDIIKDFDEEIVNQYIISMSTEDETFILPDIIFNFTLI